jgi:hypothetical protein
MDIHSCWHCCQCPLTPSHLHANCFLCRLNWLGACFTVYSILLPLMTIIWCFNYIIYLISKMLVVNKLSVIKYTQVGSPVSIRHSRMASLTVYFHTQCFNAVGTISIIVIDATSKKGLTLIVTLDLVNWLDMTMLIWLLWPQVRLPCKGQRFKKGCLRQHSTH